MTFAPYKISRLAQADLVDIEDYSSSKWGEVKTRPYLDAIADSIIKLSADSALGRRHGDIPEPYLVYSVGSHLIVYRLNIALNRIEILNILHPAMNIEARVRESLIQMNKH